MLEAICLSVFDARGKEAFSLNLNFSPVEVSFLVFPNPYILTLIIIHPLSFQPSALSYLY
jgi:hypothetical protein